MKTFNGKAQWRNVLAVLLGIVGIIILGLTWLYHLVVHFITMPGSEWIDLTDDSMWIKKTNYPNKFCDCFCNIEASMIHQLYILRVGFGEEYCDEKSTGEKND